MPSSPPTGLLQAARQHARPILRSGLRLRILIAILLALAGSLWLLLSSQACLAPTTIPRRLPIESPRVLEYIVTVDSVGSLVSSVLPPTYIDCSITQSIRTPDVALDICWAKNGELRILRIVRRGP